jgi:hypothetical protein
MNNINLYWVLNGEKYKVYNSFLQYPKDIILVKETTPYSLKIFTSDSQHAVISNDNGVKRGMDTTLIELSSIDIDTVVTQWRSESSSFGNEKLWYNGVLQSQNTILGFYVTAVK